MKKYIFWIIYSLALIITLATIKEVCFPIKEDPLAYALIAAKEIVVPSFDNIREDEATFLCNQVSQLAEIAYEYTKAGQKDKSNEILQLALQKISKIEAVDFTIIVVPILTLALKYAEIDSEEKAYEIISDYLISKTVVGETPLHKAALLNNVINYFLKAEQYNLALRIARKIIIPQKKSFSLQELVASFKATALINISKYFSENGKKNKSNEILSQALKIIDTIDSKSPRSLADIADIAVIYHKNEQKDKAYNMLTQSLQIATNMDAAFRKASNLIDIALRYIVIGQKEKAQEILSDSLQIAKATEEECVEETQDNKNINNNCMDDTGLIFYRIIKGYLELNEYEQALYIAQKMKVGRGFYWGTRILNWKIRSLIEIAVAYFNTGKKDVAKKILSEALYIANKNRNTGELLQIIAIAYARIGEHHKALKVINDKSATSRYFKFFKKPKAFEEIVNVYINNGKYSDALKLLKEINDSDFQEFTLITIADYLSKEGKYSKAFKMAKKMNPSAKAYILTKIALCYAKSGQTVDWKGRKLLRGIVKEIESLH